MAVGDKHYLALGRVAHEFSLLETVVSVGIWTALGGMNKREVRAVTAEMSANEKLSLLEALVKMKEPPSDRLEQWRTFFSDARAVAGERNRLLHSPLLSSDPAVFSDEVTTFQIERGTSARGKFGGQNYTVETMRGVAERIQKTRTVLADLLLADVSGP